MVELHEKEGAQSVDFWVGDAADKLRVLVVTTFFIRAPIRGSDEEASFGK